MTTAIMTCSKERLDDKIRIFSKFGDSGKGTITRLSLSPEEIEAREELCKRCRNLGMEIKTDDMANIYATIKGNKDLPSIMIGSHIDSIENGCNNDGLLGVLTALEIVETIVTENIEHKHPITVVIWTNKEGARFEPAMMSSGVISGKFQRDVILSAVDSDGITFKEALEASGYMGEEENRLNSKNCVAFIEAYRDKEYILYNDKVDIGVAEGKHGVFNYSSEYIKIIEKNAREYSCSCKKIDNSYGYDAQFISEIVPTALIFIPCKKEAGRFKENCVKLDDWVKCTNVILKTIIDIDKNL